MATGAQGDAGASLSGWLQKQERKTKAGKGKYIKCWFVLSREGNAWTLSHYVHGTRMREHVGAERLAQGDRVVLDLKDVKDVRYIGQKGNKFQVVTKSGDGLVLRAVNAAVCKRWAEALLDLLNMAAPEPPPPKQAATAYTDYSLKKGNIDRRRERESVTVTTAFLQDSAVFMSNARRFTERVKTKGKTLERKKKGRGNRKAGGSFDNLQDALPSPPPAASSAEVVVEDIPPPPPPPSDEDDDDDDDGASYEDVDRAAGAGAGATSPWQAHDEADGEEDVGGSEEDDKAAGSEFKKMARKNKGKGKAKRFSLTRFGSPQASLERPKAATIVSADTLKRKKNMSLVALNPKARSGVVNRGAVERGPRMAVMPNLRPGQVLADGTTDIKTDATRALIKETIDASLSLSGMLFHDLDKHAMNEMVDRMYRVDVKAKDDVVEQGHTGDKFYVISEGRFHFYTRRGDGDGGLPELVAENGPRTFFGELALLYEQPSAVTVRAVTDGVLWAISRQMFVEIRKAQARKREVRKLRLLTSMDIIADNLDESELMTLAEAMDETLYDDAGEVVIEEGKHLDKVLMIGSGTVQVLAGGKEVGELVSGDSFGEWALLERTSKADVKLITSSPNTSILSLDVDEFEAIVGSLRDLIKVKWAESVGDMFPQPAKPTSVKRSTRSLLSRTSRRKSPPLDLESKAGDEFVETTIKTIKERFSRRKSTTHRVSEALSTGSDPHDAIPLRQSKIGAAPEWEFCDLPCRDMTIKDIEPLQLLGKGSFGRVHLVRKRERGNAKAIKNLPQYMALKVLSREYIQSHGWTEMVENERHAMAELGYLTKCPFVVKLYSAFFDRRNVYFLMELLDGGDLYAVVRKRLKEPRLTETQAKFYLACVMDAVIAVHSRTIVYRDLKPENIFLCAKGYPRVADFGLAKKTFRTYTVCGTPDYMAPEIILGRGHDFAADWWAVGVLIFELTTGVTPFTGREPMDIYESVLAHRHGALVFPDFSPLTADCKDIISKLLNPKQSRRVGVVRAGFEAHPWFANFHWGRLRDMELPAPIPIERRNVSQYERRTYKNRYDARLDVAPVDRSQWVPDI